MEQHDLLRQIREVAGKTQEECAEHLDISVQQYGKYERGKADISNRNFFLICKFCRYYPILNVLEGMNYFFVKKDKANQGTTNRKTIAARIRSKIAIRRGKDKSFFINAPLIVGSY